VKRQNFNAQTQRALLIVFLAIGFITVTKNFFAQNSGQSYSVAQDVGTKESYRRKDAYFAAEYVRNRESFLYGALAENYNAVRLMTSPQLFQDFINEMRVENPSSNAARLGHVGNRSVKVRSVAIAEKDALASSKVADIHFTIEEKMNPQASVISYNKIARMKFEYTKLNINKEEELINPFGFRVLEYSLRDEPQKQVNQ
jgi:type IV secretory pathway component VirB8